MLASSPGYLAYLQGLSLGLNFGIYQCENSLVVDTQLAWLYQTAKFHFFSLSMQGKLQKKKIQDSKFLHWKIWKLIMKVIDTITNLIYANHVVRFNL